MMYIFILFLDFFVSQHIKVFTKNAPSYDYTTHIIYVNNKDERISYVLLLSIFESSQRRRSHRSGGGR